MISTQRITLKAFLIALAQQKSLPDDLMSKDIQSNLDHLNQWGNTYFPEEYYQASDLLHLPLASRNKGFSEDIDDKAERRKSEIGNLVNAIDDMEDEELVETGNLAANNWSEFIQKIDKIVYYPEA